MDGLGAERSRLKGLKCTIDLSTSAFAFNICSSIEESGFECIKSIVPEPQLAFKDGFEVVCRIDTLVQKKSRKDSTELTVKVNAAPARLLCAPFHVDRLDAVSVLLYLRRIAGRKALPPADISVFQQNGGVSREVITMPPGSQAKCPERSGLGLSMVVIVSGESVRPVFDDCGW